MKRPSGRHGPSPIFPSPKPPEGGCFYDEDQDHSLRPGADDGADSAGADRPAVLRAGGDRRRSDRCVGRAGLLRPCRQGDPGGRQCRRDHEGRRGRRRRRPDVRPLRPAAADGRVHAALRRTLRPEGHAPGEAAASGAEGAGRRHRLHRRRRWLDRHQLPCRRQGRLDHRHPDRRPQAVPVRSTTTSRPTPPSTAATRAVRCSTSTAR